MRYGIARGLFSNEAGLGSAPMVHAAADTDHPVRQGMYGIFEVFVDTILVCTTTGLVILVTGVWSSGETGAALSARAFETGLPGTWGDIVVTGGILLFSFSTLIGWSYYGETNRSAMLAARLRVNTVGGEAKYGGKTGQSLIGHTFGHQIPVAKYGKEHPEYFPLFENGQQRRQRHSLLKGLWRLSANYSKKKNEEKISVN